MINKKVELIRGDDNEIEIDGEKYYLENIKSKKINGVEHEDKLIYKKLNRKEYDKFVKVLVKKFSEMVTKEELMEQLIRGYDMKTIRAIAKRIKEGKKIEKQKGCLGFKVGEKYMELIE